MTGIQLKSILYKTGLTQIELAEKMGMSQQNFNKSLMVQDVKTGFLEKLCEVLDVKMSFFYPDDYDRGGGGSSKSAHSATAVGSGNTATTGASDDMVRQLLSQNQQLIDIIKNNL